MDEGDKQKEVVDTAAAGAALDEQAPVTPVRSAKDAINAMYAQEGGARLSDYLATSAQEIINANGRAVKNAKSAANLHRGAIKHQMEYVQPSASGILRTAKPQKPAAPSNVSSAMDPLARKNTITPPRRPTKKPTPVNTVPIVKSSLKLGPKKTPLRMAPQNLQNQSRRVDGINAQKGATNLEKILASRKSHPRTNANPANPANPQSNTSSAAPNAAEAIQVMQAATANAMGVPGPQTQPKAPRPHCPRPRGGLMQDIVRPSRSAQSVPNPTSAPVTPVASPTASTQAKQGPLDSIKRRFQAAPKGFAKTKPETQPAGYTGYEDIATPTPKPAVEIYGMMEDEPIDAKPADGLGVVEDYHPQGESVTQKVAEGSGGAAPDNNKYAIKGQSPFFLKSVKVEKRPLSDAPRSKKSTASEGTLYEKPSKESLGKKNTYEKKSSPKKAVPTKPTVIVPASRRSKAPLIILMILTVILGAAFGAFIYLFFFKYME